MLQRVFDITSAIRWSRTRADHYCSARPPPLATQCSVLRTPLTRIAFFSLPGCLTSGQSSLHSRPTPGDCPLLEWPSMSTVHPRAPGHSDHCPGQDIRWSDVQCVNADTMETPLYLLFPYCRSVGGYCERVTLALLDSSSSAAVSTTSFGRREPIELSEETPFRERCQIVVLNIVNQFRHWIWLGDVKDSTFDVCHVFSVINTLWMNCYGRFHIFDVKCIKYYESLCETRLEIRKIMRWCCNIHLFLQTNKIYKDPFWSYEIVIYIIYIIYGKSASSHNLDITSSVC